VADSRQTEVNNSISEAVYKPKVKSESSFDTNQSLFETSLEKYKSNSEMCKLLSKFERWLEYTRNRVLIFVKRDTDHEVLDVEDIMILPWIHRWKKEYMLKIKKMFRDALEDHQNESFVHLVITCERKYDIGFYMRLIKKVWNMLNDMLKKRGIEFSYVSVLEPHQDGYPHLHVLMFTKQYVINVEELRQYVVEKGLGYEVFIKRYWSTAGGKKPLYYLMKYLSKYFESENWSFSMKLFFAYLWDTHTRTISSSRGFFSYNVKVVKHEWILYAVSTIEELEYTLMLMNVKHDVIMKIYNGLSPPNNS